ncbi:protein FAM214A [Lingula anatina]|uniref:Protein FAM214A n=1 Tax=Lingula anatina TaxID=7574 RepID=A0A1S3JB67_LINAN|nr:protein FAM214A [Lingula anatina]|eukprot:XP_013407650.1 protein FAM214A [Lingula anatina]
MKPDQGLSQDMEEEEEELDPWELFLELGMLIIESRMPEFSAKGRVEGPHCLLVTSRGTNHECDKGNKQCNMVSELRDQMLMLWKNGIPMCIEVLVYPDCQHVAKLYEAQLSPAEGTCVMLEEWTIQVSPKRMLDSHCGSRSLVQATRSHLHFSQLSAWLNVSRGTQPANVVYR